MERPLGRGPGCRLGSSTNWETIWLSQGEWSVSGSVVTGTWGRRVCQSSDQFLVPGLVTLRVCFLTYIKDVLFISQGHYNSPMRKALFAAADVE